MALRLGAPTGEPVLARQVATTTAAILHLDAVGGGVAPPGVNHMPCGVIFETAGNFVFTDASGTTLTLTVPASALGLYVPISLATIDVTSIPAVIVFWRR